MSTRISNVTPLRYARRHFGTAPPRVRTARAAARCCGNRCTVNIDIVLSGGDDDSSLLPTCVTFDIPRAPHVPLPLPVFIDVVVADVVSLEAWLYGGWHPVMAAMTPKRGVCGLRA